jgi:hypothetical protein
VDRRDSVRLGDHQDFWFACPPADLAGEYRRLRARTAAVGAQEAETGARQRDQPVMGTATLQPVIAGAEEGEMVVRKPFEESAGLGGVRTRDSGDAVAQVHGELGGPGAHLRPVGDGEPHVVEHRQDPCADLREPRGVRHAIDLDVLPGFGVRMDVLFRRQPGQTPAAVTLCVQHRVHHQVYR